MEPTSGCLDGYFACCSHLRQPYRAFRAPAHCRRRNWYGLNHKLTANQPPRIDQGGTRRTHRNCPLASLESWRGTWRRPYPSQCLTIVENVGRVWCIGHPGNRNGVRSAWRIQQRRVVVGGKRKERTIRAGPNDGRCRPGCKVMEWDSCGNGGKKGDYLKDAQQKARYRRHGPCCHPKSSHSGNSRTDRHRLLEKTVYRQH